MPTNPEQREHEPRPGKWFDDLTPEMPAHVAAHRVLDVRLHAALESFEHARAHGVEEPDAIRRARVATRRARSAITAFRDLLPKRSAKKLRAMLKEMRFLAGEPRAQGLDFDALSARLAGAPSSERDGIVYALGVLHTQQSITFLRLLDDASIDLDEFRGHAGKVVRKLAAAEGARTLDEHAAQPLASARGALSAHLGEPLDSLEKLHDLRLHIKRLRYTDEVFRCCIDDAEFDRLYPAAKAAQGELGGLNDLHELCERVGLMVSLCDAPAPVKESLACLSTALVSERELARDRFLAWWHDPTTEAPRTILDILGVNAGDAESHTLESPSVVRSIDRAIETAVIRSQQNESTP